MNQKKVTIYSTKICPFCIKAKMLFESKKIKFEEIDVSTDENLRISMVAKAGGRKTVPQIFIGEIHVGGYDDLHDLEKKGELQSLVFS